MTVSTQGTVVRYLGDSVTTVFATPYVNNSGSLRVYVAGVLKVLGTDYTVTPIGTPPPSQTVRYNVTFSVAPAAGSVVVIDLGNLYGAISQGITYTNFQGNAAVTETGFDRGVLETQLIRDADYYTSRLVPTTPSGIYSVLDFSDFSIPSSPAARVFLSEPVTSVSYKFLNAYPFPVESRFRLYMNVTASLTTVTFTDGTGGFSLIWGPGGAPNLTTTGLHILDFCTIGDSIFLGTYVGTLPFI
jgi:hypothetical protein